MLTIDNLDTSAITNRTYNGFIFTADQPEHATIAIYDKEWGGWWWR